jgi:organic hydroperoxide reductase OsmC/OhrA
MLDVYGACHTTWLLLVLQQQLQQLLSDVTTEKKLLQMSCNCANVIQEYYTAATVGLVPSAVICQ